MHTYNGREALSTGEAAKLIGLNSKTLRRWVDIGKVEGYKSVGGMRFVYADSLQAIIQSRQESQTNSN